MSERKYALEIADWCARELETARRTGNLETRPFVQNAQLIIDALREYGGKPDDIDYLRSIAGCVSDGSSMADIKARNDRLAESLK